MNKTLQWKVATVLGYVTVLMVTLAMCGEEALPSARLVWRLAVPV